METVRVLMVDDNPDDLELFGRALRQSEEWQPELVTAMDGEAAGLQLQSGGPFDVVLLDHKLPPRNGLDLLEEWSDAMPDLPAVVMLTGHGGERIAVEAMKSGAFDYLSKNDCDEEELRQTIRCAATVTRLRRALHQERGRRAEVEARLREALTESSEASEMSGVRRTVATFLHEINSPLTGIVGYVKMLKEAEDSSEKRAICDEVLDACRRMAQVLHSMETLDEARVRPGGKRSGPLDLRALM